MRRLVSSLQSAAKSALRPGRMLVPIAAASMLMAGGTQALTTNGNFNVIVNLTASCSIATPISDITANYIAGQTAVLTGSAVQTTAAITCTSGVPYSIALDTGLGATAVTPLIYTGYSDASVSISYSLTLSGAGLSSLGSNTGSGTAQNVTIQAIFGGNQPGSCAVATLVSGGCNNSANAARLRTLTINY